MLCKTLKIYLFLIGMVLSGTFSNGQNIDSQQYLFTRSTIFEENNLKGGLIMRRLTYRLQGIKNSWFCGSYFGYGFHEDGLKSAINVANKL